jgi:adenosine deaminase
MNRPTPDPATSEFIRSLPKTETHLHLEGALPWHLLCAAKPEKYIDPPESWAPDFRFRSFAHFETELLGYAADFFTSAQRYHDCAGEIFRDRLSHNVRYMEVSFASGCIDFLNLDGREVVDAIRDAVPPGLEVRIFLGIHHDGWTPRMVPVLEDALGWKNLDGIDLHGTEETPIDNRAPDYWRRAREAGKFTKAHAGEFCGPDFVRHVIEVLGAQRIEHGIRSIEDPSVVELLCERNIALDVCPISNVKLGAVSSARNHPIKRLLDAGVVCTVSTDDPLSFGNTIEDEYLLLASELGFPNDDLARVAQNGFQVALGDRNG